MLTRELTRVARGHAWVALEFKPADLWIGMFWKRSSRGAWDASGQWAGAGSRVLDVWICLVPMLPIHLHLESSS